MAISIEDVYSVADRLAESGQQPTLAAVRSAINAICKVILKDHIDHCIVDAIKFGDKETIEELKEAIETLIK